MKNVDTGIKKTSVIKTNSNNNKTFHVFVDWLVLFSASRKPFLVASNLYFSRFFFKQSMNDYILHM